MLDLINSIFFCITHPKLKTEAEAANGGNGSGIYVRCLLFYKINNSNL